jgi:hypothetical protein
MYVYAREEKNTAPALSTPLPSPLESDIIITTSHPLQPLTTPHNPSMPPLASSSLKSAPSPCTRSISF